MSIAREFEYISDLLEHATTHYTNKVLGKEPEYIATVKPGVELVSGMFTYLRRLVVPGQRLLTPDITTQPALGIREAGKITVIAYPEDINRHPLRDDLISTLEILYCTGE